MRLCLFALAATLALPCVAQDYPKLKSGQWELVTRMNAATAAGAPPPTRSTMCTDEALQKEMMSMGAGTTKEMCSKNETKREGNQIIGTAECKLGESKISSRSVMTLTGDTGYRTEITATYDPPVNGTRESRITLEGKYVGPCRDGLVPGDFIGPNGQKFNLKGIAAGKGQMPPPSAQPKSPAKAPQ
jgi:hypothetical protein